MSIIRPDTPAMVMDSAIGILKIQQVGVITQTSVPPNESIIPPRIPNNITISHVSLSESGYEPVALRSSGMGSPPASTQETSILPRLHGPRSLPPVNPTQERMGRLSDQMRQDPSQVSTYIMDNHCKQKEGIP